MIAFLGILMWVIVNLWLTLYAFLATVPTFGDNTLINGGFWSKLLKIILWGIALSSWIWMFSSIDIKVA